MGKNKIIDRVFVFLAIITWAVIVICLSVHTGGSAQAETNTAKTLKIGYLLTLSGWHSVFDLVEERDLKIVAQIINEKGGITVKGERYNIELVGEDGKSTLDGITAAATRLIYDRQVNFVVGPNAFWTMAASPMFTSNKVLHVSGASTTQPGELDSTTPYGFLGHNSSVGGCLIDVQALKREYPDVKKVAIVTPDDGSIPYLVPKLKKILGLNGYTVTGDVVGYSNEMVDYSPIASKLNSIKDADAVYMKNGAPQSGAGIIKALRQLGNNKPFVCSILTAGNDLAAIMEKEVATNVIAVGLDPKAPNNPPLVNEIFKRGGQKSPIFLLVPNALWVLSKVIEAADSLDPTVVKAKWESMKEVDTLFGKGMMGGDETYGIKGHAVSHPWAYQKIMNGKVIYGPWIDAGVIP